MGSIPVGTTKTDIMHCFSMLYVRFFCLVFSDLLLKFPTTLPDHLNKPLLFGQWYYSVKLVSEGGDFGNIVQFELHKSSGLTNNIQVIVPVVTDDPLSADKPLH